MVNYISLKVILDNLLDHSMLKNLSMERAINYAVNFIRLIGCPDIFIEKTDIIKIQEYRGVIPCDYNNIIQVRTKPINGHYKVFRSSTDNFHMSPYKQNSYDLTYKLQGNVIYTSMKEGEIELVYNAIQTDEDGFPMIPDNVTFINALELYIKKKVFTQLFDEGKIQQPVYNNVCQEYAFAVGQAQNNLIMPNEDQMQSLVNSLTSLVPKMSLHKTGFINLGTQEKINVQ